MSSDYNEEAQKIQDELQIKLKEINKLGKVIFNSTEGKVFLKHLLEVFVIQNNVSPYSANERYACFREGQNDIVRMLVKMGGNIYDK